MRGFSVRWCNRFYELWLSKSVDLLSSFVMIKIYHSGLIQFLVDGHTFCISVLEHSIINKDSLGNTSLSLCYCRYAQVLPVALSWENKLERLIVKSFWTPRIFYLWVNYDGTIPHQNWSACLPGVALLSPSDMADWQLTYIRRPPSSQHIQYVTFIYNFNMWWPSLLRSEGS